MFPAAFNNLALVVSRGSQILGKIYGYGSFSFPGSPGSYQLTFVATPPANQQFGMYGVSMVFSAPTVSLTSSVATATTGSLVTLNWSATNATSCTASGGGWTGSKAASSGSEAVVLTATTTYTLTCTGTGGAAAQSVTVTATPKPSSSGGGGAMNIELLALAGMLLSGRVRRYAMDGSRLR
jgi:hypothetical protein